MKTRTFCTILGLEMLAMLAFPLHAQNRTAFAGERNAIDYAYGTVRAVPPPLLVGNTVAAGTSVSLTVQFGYTTTGDGLVFNPLATNAPVTIGIGASMETVTPSAVSCATPSVYNSCTFTATTAFAHGINDPVASGTFGLQEAINLMNSGGGGLVAITQGWTQAGGTNATIALTSAYSNVSIHDNRGGSFAPYWTMQPTTLTVLAPPTTLTATNIVFTAATGTWAASSTHFLATCVDPLGGESAASADYTQTPTLNFTLTVPVAPTCATGAVGWRLYAGTSSSALTYLLPITSANCALSTLETVMPSCAIGATGTWAATFTTTTNLSPVALGVTNTSNPVPQGHTLFGYQPSGSAGYPFQTNYGPFGSGAIASATNSDNTILGSFNLPTGFLNDITRVVRITGKIKMTAGASSTLGIGVGMVWAGGVTAGAPVAVCNPTSGFVWATAAAIVNFGCTLTTNAVGTTAIGTIQPESWFMGNTVAGTGTTSPTGTEIAAGTVGTLGLFSQDEFSIYLQPLVAADTTVQLMSLHIEIVQ